MKRVYVIMCDSYDNGEFIDTDPVDVVFSLTKAEDICVELEAEDPANVYYWREIISSEE